MKAEIKFGEKNPGSTNNKGTEFVAYFKLLFIRIFLKARGTGKG